MRDDLGQPVFRCFADALTDQLMFLSLLEKSANELRSEGCFWRIAATTEILRL